MGDITQISTLVDNLVKAGLLDGFTDCDDMTEECFTCSQYADCLNAKIED